MNAPHPDPNRPSAVDELTLLQAVIIEHEKHAFTVMAFMSAVIAGLATLALSPKTKWEWWVIFLVGLGAIGAFALWTLAHRALAGKAIARAQLIEDQIAVGRLYDGYKLSHFMGTTELDSFRAAAKHWTFKIPVATALFIVIVISGLSFANRDNGVGESLDSAIADAVKQHIAVRTSISANSSKAAVTADISSQSCTLELQQQGLATTSWIVSNIACKASEPQSVDAVRVPLAKNAAKLSSTPALKGDADTLGITAFAAQPAAIATSSPACCICSTLAPLPPRKTKAKLLNKPGHLPEILAPCRKGP